MATSKKSKQKNKKQLVRTTLSSAKKRQKDFLDRRPHRSFRMTKRRDYHRAWTIPGYWSFTNYVRAVLWQNKRIFGVVFALYALLTVAVLGIASQDSYTQIREVLQNAGQDIGAGDLSASVQVLAIFGVAISGGLSPELTETQQVYNAILLLFTWLVVVWLIRHRLAGNAVKARDGIYSAGAPIAATFVVGLVILLQVLPIALASIAYNAGESSGFIQDGFGAMAFFVVVALFGVMSLYWLTSSMIALAIVTLPGMYPFSALRVAGDLVLGRRLRVLLRLLWLVLTILVVWALLLVPVLFIDNWIGVSWLPIVPMVILALSSASIIWSAAYVYLLYRRLVDDETAS